MWIKKFWLEEGMNELFKYKILELKLSFFIDSRYGGFLLYLEREIG